MVSTDCCAMSGRDRGGVPWAGYCPRIGNSRIRADTNHMRERWGWFYDMCSEAERIGMYRGYGREALRHAGSVPVCCGGARLPLLELNRNSCQPLVSWLGF